MFDLKSCEETRLNGKTLLEWVNDDPERLESMFENCFCEETSQKIMVVYKFHILDKKVREKKKRTEEKYGDKK